MTDDTVYTGRQIAEMWNDYRARNIYRVFKGGVASVSLTMPANMEGVVRCDMQPACKLISFPKFLELISA